MNDFNIPGILNPGGTPRASERVLTDYQGNFSVVITDPLPKSYTPSISVMIAFENTVNPQPILHDRVGLLATRRPHPTGLTEWVWSNSACNPNGFLLRRGTYVLRAVIDGLERAPVYVVSRSTPQRPDWPDYVWSSEHVFSETGSLLLI